MVIPTNRIDLWLDLAVESVLSENLSDLELIIVLDGVELPEDREWRVDPRVRILHIPRSLGPAAAMNIAIATIKSPYVARLDSDDRDLPGRLAKEVAYLDEHPDVVAVSSRTHRIDENGVRRGVVRLPAGADIRRHLLVSNVVPHSTLAFRRDAAEAVGLYNPELRQMEDYDLILRLAVIGPIAQFEEPLVEYRVHRNQTSRGAAPHGQHIRDIGKGRLALARSLGVSGLRARLEHAAWVVMQYLRWWGVVRPGHER